MLKYISTFCKPPVTLAKSVISSLATAVAPFVYAQIFKEAYNSIAALFEKSPSSASSQSLNSLSSDTHDSEFSYSDPKFLLQSAIILCVLIPMGTYKLKQLSNSKAFPDETTRLLERKNAIKRGKNTYPLLPLLSLITISLPDALINTLPLTLILHEGSKQLELNKVETIAWHSSNLLFSCFCFILLLIQNHKFTQFSHKSAGLDMMSSFIRHMATVVSFLHYGFNLLNPSESESDNIINWAFLIWGIINLPNVLNLLAKHINLQRSVSVDSVFSVSPARALFAGMLTSYSINDASLYAFNGLKYLTLFLPNLNKHITNDEKVILSAYCLLTFAPLWALAYCDKYRKGAEKLADSYRAGGVKLMFTSSPRQALAYVIDQDSNYSNSEVSDYSEDYSM